MPLRTFDHEDPPLLLREELCYSRNRCETHDLAKTYVPIFVALLEDWAVVFAKFLALQDKIASEDVTIDACDDTLGALIDEVAAALLLGNNDRSSPEFLAYFGNKQPYEVKRPLLGDELDLARSWLPSLKASTNVHLDGLGARTESLVQKADETIKALGLAKQAQRDFRLTGEYAQFVDKLNAERKSIYGELGKAAHSPDAKGLPSNFPDWFFRHERRRNKKQTLQAAQDQITELESELAKQKALFAELEAKATADEQAEQTRKLLEAELAQAELAQAELEKKTAELKAKLKK